MNGVTMQQLILRGVLLAVAGVGFASGAWGQTYNLDLRVYRGSQLLNPASFTNLTGSQSHSSPTYFDDNSDGTNDRAHYTITAPTGNQYIAIVVTDDDAVKDRMIWSMGSHWYVKEFGQNQTGSQYKVDSDTEVTLYLLGTLQAEVEPLSERLAPGANTVTGSLPIWGQAFPAKRRVLDHPNRSANMYSGEITDAAVDLHVPGRGLDFVWSRRYRTQADPYANLGWGWDHSYNIYLDEELGTARDEALVHMGNGRVEHFLKDTSISNDYYHYYYCVGWEAELVKDIANYEFTLTFGNGVKWTFDSDSEVFTKIERIEDRFGNVLTFAYDDLERLTTITDTLGRQYALDYDDSDPNRRDHLILSLTEVHGKGRVINYAYYGAAESGGNPGDLKTVTYPAITGTVTGNNFPSGRSLAYTYNTSVDPRLHGNLLTIVDGRGNTALENTYNSAGQVTKQVWAGSGATDAVVMFDYPSPGTGLLSGETKKTIANDADGNVTEFFFNSDNQLLRKVQYTGRALPGIVTTETTNRPSGKVRATDPDYYETKFAWNSHDLLTEVTNPSGNRTVITYNTAVRKRIADILKIERFTGPGATPSTSDEFTHASGWTSDANKFRTSRCGGSFVEEHVVKDGSTVNNRIHVSVRWTPWYAAEGEFGKTVDGRPHGFLLFWRRSGGGKAAGLAQAWRSAFQRPGNSSWRSALGSVVTRRSTSRR